MNITMQNNRGSFEIHQLGNHPEYGCRGHMADIIGSGYSNKREVVDLQLGNAIDSHWQENAKGIYCGSTKYENDSNNVENFNNHWFITEMDGRLMLASTYGSSFISTYAMPIPRDLDWYERAKEMLD